MVLRYLVIVIFILIVCASWLVSPPLPTKSLAYASPMDSFAHMLPDYELPFGKNLFAPSNATSTTGKFIAQSEFIPASRCGSCHSTEHAEWNESAHRNSFREPFYQANVKHLIKERGIAVTRHCESCHNPVALFSGVLTTESKSLRPFDEEGVSCSVCHSIEFTTTQGIGSYIIAPPALLVRENGERFKDVTDAEIIADLPSHYRAVSKPLLKTAEFCAACHKAAVVPELNKRKWLRSFAIYDEWQQSAFSTETVQPLSQRPRQTCQSCHMPVKDTLASHRWPGANTAIPAFYGWPEQFAATTQLLKSDIIAIDIFGIRNGSKDIFEPAVPINQTSVQVGQTVTFDVTIANRGVAHSFPAELRDIFEAWLEFKAVDAKGKVIFHSGEVRDDGRLDDDAHAYRTVPIDDNGQPIIKHDIWNTRVGAFDRHIPAGRVDIGSFSFAIPDYALLPISVTAKLNYRRFTRNFTDWVSQDKAVSFAPVTEMVSKTIAIDQQNKTTPLPSFIQWRAYGVALFDQQQHEAAAMAFEQAKKLTSTPIESLSVNIDLALTYLRMERVGSSQSILDKAEKLLLEALTINKESARARYYQALLNIKRFRYTEALTQLEKLSQEYPRDRQVLHQIASIHFLQRNDQAAQSTYEKILAIDPDDTEANMKLTGLYWRFGDVEKAKQGQALYQGRHTDTVGETLRRDYLRKHSELYATWPWREFGDNPIGSMP